MDHPRIGVGVFVRNNGKILLQKRIGAHGANTWSLPGGHLEMYETVEQCAAREAFEEFGIKIKNIKILGFTNDMMRDEQKHYITFFVDSELDEGTPSIKEPEKTAEFAWFNIKKLPSPLFYPLKQFLEQHTFT
jgi:8-oxo-dGTP diphosphatase